MTRRGILAFLAAALALVALLAGCATAPTGDRKSVV